MKPRKERKFFVCFRWPHDKHGMVRRVQRPDLMEPGGWSDHVFDEADCAEEIEARLKIGGYEKVWREEVMT